MKTVLVTGGTVFVSRRIAEYFAQRGNTVYVLNRNTRPQVSGVRLIQCDRHQLNDELNNIHSDLVVDTGYTAEDVTSLIDALGSFDDYVLISSSAVYPETEQQPFTENTPTGRNSFWGNYGTDKIEAEKALLERIPDAWIIRPPYLYGPYNNVDRESFVFRCAMKHRAFHMPKDGSLPLQFFHIDDLCRIIEFIHDTHPSAHILNVGNPKTITVKQWIRMCYDTVGTQLEITCVDPSVPQRSYFPFYDYAYQLDVSAMETLLPETIPMEQGLKQAYDWYVKHMDEVKEKPFLSFIDAYL
ncbi:MAG: NAD-dependent epimerase/dehydratase family protein [Bulleidia sp.]